MEREPSSRRPRPRVPTRQFVPARRPIPDSVPDFLTPHRYARMLDVLDRRQPDLTVVLEDIHDPHNVGAVLRSCDAVGIGLVHVVQSIEPLPELRPGTTASADLWVEVRRHASIAKLCGELREEGFAVVATSVGEDARTPWEIDFSKPVALVLGNEQRGVTPEAAAAADLRVQIPMQGMVQSFNLSVAAGILLYEVLRQRQAAGMYHRPRLPEPLRQRTLETWLARERGTQRG